MPSFKKLIIFASGRGSNAIAIHEHFRKIGGAEIALVVSNKKDAGVLDWAASNNIETVCIDKTNFSSHDFLGHLQAINPALLVLAGFLWKIPATLIDAFPQRIINIHPALLPKHGGKGMWGHNVHEAVLAAGDKQSGITVHYVNSNYDEGGIILQARCLVDAADGANNLAARVLGLEHFYFARVIEQLLK